MTLRIECPKCRQGFEVGEELKGRTVECGSCQHRFQVTAAVLGAPPRERFYPDEARKNVDLSRFGRAPVENGAVEFRTADYDQPPLKNTIGPIPPVRGFAVIGGLVVLLLSALAFFFGSMPNVSLLQDVERPDRLMLAGFLGLVGFVLVTWGMIRNRFIGFVLGFLGALGLVALANFLPVHRSPTYDSQAGALSLDEEDNAIPKPPTFFPGITKEPLTPQEVMKQTRWESAMLNLIASDENQVAAIWVRSMEEFHRVQLQNYLQQEFGLSTRPDFRSLKDGGLFVLSGVPLDLDQVEASAERFGEVEQVLPELRLVQMQVNATVLGGRASSNEITSKLNDSSDGAFYQLNYEELIALDRERVKKAVIRLSNAEPIRMRKDITVRLVGLLGGNQDAETYGYLAQALNVWSEEGDGADRVLSNLTLKMRSRGQDVPNAVLRFLAARKTPEAANLMVELWAEDPTGKNRFLVSYGSQAASLITPYLRSTEAGIARSAARLLGEIGTQSELTQMREALTSSQNEEFKTVLQASIERVARR